VASKAALLKRLEKIEKAISFRQPRIFLVTAPCDWEGVIGAETQAEIDRLLAAHHRTDADLVIRLVQFGCEDEEPTVTVSGSVSRLPALRRS
jgi:hypothetical protein